MKISIIIPLYKIDYYLNQLLNCLNQLRFNDKIEVIFVFNGNYESFVGELKTMLKKYIDNNRFVVKLYCTSIKGVSNARNIGIENSSGDYLVFIDDDDLVSIDYIIELYERARGSQDSIVVSNVIGFCDNMENYRVDYLGITFTKLFENGGKTRNFFRYRSFFSSACCKMIPRSAIGNVRFDNDLKNGEDSLFMFEISKNINSIISTSLDTIYHRRLHQSSVSQGGKIKYSKGFKFHLCIKYFKIYFNNVFSYNFFLFFSRIVAVLIKK